MAVDMEEKESFSSQEILKTERYLWISRAFSAVAVLAFVANMILFAAIGSLYPLVRIQPFYLNILEKSQQVIDITPVTSEELENDESVVVESLVRQYVLSRYEIGHDIQEVEERWGPDGIISLMSAQDVYEEFLKLNQELLDDARTDGLTMSATITYANKLDKNPYKWQLGVSLKQMRQSSREPEEMNMVVELFVQFDPLMKKTNRTFWQDRLKNPLGFRVMTYGSAFVK